MSIEETKKVITLYVTEDGKEFMNKADAKAHDDRLKSTKFFEVFYNPDLTETGRLMKTDYIEVKARWGAELLACAWAEKYFGSSVAFVQGTAPCRRWKLNEIEYSELLEEEYKRLAVITGASNGKVNYF